MLIALALVALAGIGSAEPARGVTIASASDASGEADPDVRKHNVETMRRVLDPAIAAIDAEARRLELDARQLDVSIVRLELTSDDTKVYIASELRLVISDANGRMLSMISSSATVEVPLPRYRASRLPKLHDQALENASSSLADSVRAHVLHPREPEA
jgi:hypothetical protein